MPSDRFIEWSKTLLFVIGLVFSISSLSYAASKDPATPSSPATAPAASVPQTEPNPNDNPMLAQYLKDGIKLYYLGSRSGLDGWFLLKEGQIQVAYTTADKQSIILGALFGTDGSGITEQAIQQLYLTHPDITQAMQQNLIQQQKNSLNPASQAVGPGQFAQPQAPGDKLIAQLQVAGGVDIGDSHVPQIYMIVDPDCPHCQATWKTLREFVLNKTLQIRMIPIGRNDEEENAAAMLLKSSDPLTAWDKYVGGDKAALAGKPDPTQITFVKLNHTIIDRWNINETPYIVYRGKDKKVKIIAGEPKKIDDLMSDLGAK